ncbi:serine hydrolase [Thermobifida halotolerans]|uniref:Serine hydrolase n=1 Tax=Thermobifida halotolerans TaxID=483545 RepID=A0A399FUX1_9ACTN|nr:serine hydrolase [Thermobifida halotolerans]UOE18028.1 serine hydrolase [Thermobifida halotolerans]
MQKRSMTPAHPPAPLRTAFLAALVFLLTSTVLAVFSPEEPRTRGSAAPAAPRPERPPATPEPEQRLPPLSDADRERLDRSLDEYLEEQECRLSIALHDLRRGAIYSYAPQETYITASLVKLNILVLLLLQADDGGRELSASEHALASSMIRYSDNDATDELYARIGFDQGFAEGNRRLGLRGTEAGGGGVWGATRTTTTDQIRLLRVVFTDVSPLSERSRRYARELLGAVAPEQAWGVSVAAAEGDTVELKNGWVPRSTDGNRWAVTSAGRVAGADHEYLIAVLSDHHRDYFSGIECVEHVVTEVVTALEGGDWV